MLYPGGPCHVTVTRKQLSVYCRFEEDLLHSLLPAERERGKMRRVRERVREKWENRATEREEEEEMKDERLRGER